MTYKIEKYDNFGRGITYYNDLITFVSDTLIGEEVTFDIIKNNKKYNEAKVTNIITKSLNRIDAKCPYYEVCGGCQTRCLNKCEEELFKTKKVKDIIKRAINKDMDITYIDTLNKDEYRNKITLKIKNSVWGFYKTKTHELTKINNCLLAKKSINDLINDKDLIKIKNGEIVIRSNYNDELLIAITSDCDVDINIDSLKEKHKIVGVILNNKILYGEDYFMEVINNKYFKVSYDSFFQINNEILKSVSNIIFDNTKDTNTLLDLYCGVGTLGIMSNAKKIYGIEIIQNAILNAISNAKVNNKEAYYMLGDLEKIIDKVKDEIDVIVIDPPRSGIDKNTIDYIINSNAKKIIYMSCDPITLGRDLKELTTKYELNKLYVLNMFPNTYHVESICVLNRH